MRGRLTRRKTVQYSATAWVPAHSKVECGAPGLENTLGYEMSPLGTPWQGTWGPCTVFALSGNFIIISYYDVSKARTSQSPERGSAPWGWGGTFGGGAGSEVRAGELEAVGLRCPPRVPSRGLFLLSGCLGWPLPPSPPTVASCLALAGARRGPACGPARRAARAHLLFVPVGCNRNQPLGRFLGSCPRMSCWPGPAGPGRRGPPCPGPRPEASGPRGEAGPHSG